MSTLRILCIGDLVGNLGCRMFQKHSAALRAQYKADLVIVNGENSASRGRGITGRVARFLRANGADVITTGNHVWAEQDVVEYFAQQTDVLRPANFPGLCPGTGITLATTPAGEKVGILNVQGRVFMKEHLSCPLATADSALSYFQGKTKVIIVDFHAEATAEKAGLGWYLDGRVSAVVGTHTHVQTADERILPQGTAFISDLGMGGALNSMIGMKKEPIIRNLLTQMPTKYVVEESAPAILCGVCIEVDSVTGKALSIKRFQVIDSEIISQEIK